MDYLSGGFKRIYSRSKVPLVLLPPPTKHPESVQGERANCAIAADADKPSSCQGEYQKSRWSSSVLLVPLGMRPTLALQERGVKQRCRRDTIHPGGPADNSSVERVGTGVAPSAAINKAGFPYMRVITSVLGGFKEKVVL